MIATARLAAQAGEDLEDAQERAGDLFDQVVDSLPRVGIALGVLFAFWVVSRLLCHVLVRRFERTRPPSFTQVVPKLAGWAVVALGVVVGVTIAFPGVDPVDMIAGLGIVSVAAGFAFQDILSNLLSGILLIARQPFVAGDQIEVNEIQGTVQGITIRETAIETFDGRRVLVPNKDVYQNSITIQTAHECVRTTLVVGCSYDDDLARAAETAVRAARQTEGVLREPGPEGLFCEFGDSSVNLELRFWSDPRQIELLRTQHRVVLAVKAAFDEEGLDIPWPIRTLEASESFRGAVSGSR
ncbi:MAG: mechanosensitive ion channel family protein [Microthrixaceae bacterium]